MIDSGEQWEIIGRIALAAFLGAGLIFREGMSVRGVTTAATIWATAAVGVAVSIEAHIVAVFGALIAVVLLELRVFTKNLRPSDWDESDDERQRRIPRDE